MDLSPTRLKRLLPIAAAAIGTSVALLIAILPEWRLVALVEGLRLPSLLTAATPPLGFKARMLLAVAMGGLAGGGAFAALRLALGYLPAPHQDGVPVLRRADAHPDAPARRPIRASEDLGDPLPMRSRAIITAAAPEPVVERTVPVDLDTPLAALDPGAILVAPREPVRPVAPLARAAPADAFELVPIRRAARAKPARDALPATVSGLLDRLEKEAARGTRPQPSAEGLGDLRSLAMR